MVYWWEQNAPRNELPHSAFEAWNAGSLSLLGRYPDPVFYSRVMGPLNQVMWSWEVERMDEEMARNAKLQTNEEWNKMVAEFTPHVESSSIGDALWMQVSQTD